MSFKTELRNLADAANRTEGEKIASEIIPAIKAILLKYAILGNYDISISLLNEDFKSLYKGLNVILKNDVFTQVLAEHLETMELFCDILSDGAVSSIDVSW